MSEVPKTNVLIKGRAPRKSHKTYVHNKDLWIMLLGYVRYAMGRMSTAPGIAHDMIRSYTDNLEDEQLEQIAREIVEQLELHERMNETLGMACDHQTWKEVVQTIRTQQAWRARKK